MANLEIANQMAESYGTQFVPATVRGDMFLQSPKFSAVLHRTEKGLASDAELLELAADMVDRGFHVEMSAGNHLFLWLRQSQSAPGTLPDLGR